jgi:hypothetical protein
MKISAIVPGHVLWEMNDAAWSGAVRAKGRIAGVLRLMFGREAEPGSTLRQQRYAALAGDGLMPDMMPFLAPECVQRLQDENDPLGTD